MSIDIQSAELILQFLRENNLGRSLDTLQEESTITLNTVDSVDEFVGQIRLGKWDQVLQTLIPLRLPARQLMDLYEHIVIELLEMGETSAARSLLRETEPMDLLKENYQDRYLHLESLMAHPANAKDGYPDGKSKERRRKEIAEALAQQVHAVSPNRLLALLGQAMKWQRYQGMLPTDAELSTGHYDLFRDTMPGTEQDSGQDTVPAECYNVIKFTKKQHPESVAFSPDGTMLALGSVDGIIEIYSHETGKLRKDLKYQADGELMIMDTAVLCLSFAKDSEHLASGSQDGKIFVWNASDGSLVRKFNSAHSQGVTCICFNSDGSQILSGGFDNVVRIHGLKSGRMLKEFRGHASFVNDVLFSPDRSRVASASSDGTVRIWDVATTHSLVSVSLHEGEIAGAGVQCASIQRLLRNPKFPDQFVAITKSRFVYLLNFKAQLLRIYTPSKYQNVANEKATTADFSTGCMSIRGDYLYAIAEDNQMYVFSTETGKAEGLPRKVSETEVLNLAHHPLRNIMAILSEDGAVGLWKAEALK